MYIILLFMKICIAIISVQIKPASHNFWDILNMYREEWQIEGRTIARRTGMKESTTTDIRKDLIIELWHWNSLFRFEFNAPIEFVAFIAYAATTLHVTARRADVALRPSVNVVFSLQKGEWEKEARERKGTNEASDRELRERMRIETSYRYESATGCQPARLRASRMFLFIPLVSLSFTPVALSRPQYLFSSVTSVPASRFTSAISHLDTRRNVSGRWKRRRGRR